MKNITDAEKLAKLFYETIKARAVHHPGIKSSDESWEEHNPDAKRLLIETFEILSKVLGL